MGDAIAAIVAAYRATRHQDWRRLRQVPLVHGVEALTRTGTPFALAADEAAVVKEAVEAFAGLFSDEYEGIRLCALDYGLNVIIGALAIAAGERPVPDAGGETPSAVAATDDARGLR